MLQSLLCLPSFSPSKTLNKSSSHLSSNPPYYLKFHTTNQENLRYLKAIGVLHPNSKPPSQSISQIISTINFFKSKGFQDSDFSTLISICPQLLSYQFHFTQIDPLFHFLASDLHASPQASRGFIINCPQIMFSDVEFCLKPTLNYLRRLKIPKLNVPSKSNAYLLNTRVEKLESKIKFLKSRGFSDKEAASFSARIPAMFRYSVENNLKPKLDYLLKDMGRSMVELKEFPQYFGFSLRQRIVPRHLHLKERNVRIKLNRMLMWSDQRFYAKWK
ncbi:transcription termination factor MTEF1, chloroplastic [Euphorbia lathyris]|uniref:transcription termination factor MTEF1, chloroplastic n=1 Tax=Euphorbia lathyris TaxID=212925 RepID=UPI0033140544